MRRVPKEPKSLKGNIPITEFKTKEPMLILRQVNRDGVTIWTVFNLN